MTRRDLLAAAGGLALARALPAARPAGPEAVWDAADADGDLWRDSSGRDRHARLVGAVKSTLFGRPTVRPGPGAHAVVDQPLGDGWEALTVVAYLQLDQPRAGWQGIACRDRTGGAEGDVWALLVDPDGRFAARAASAAGQVSAVAEATAGWHQVALRFDGSRLGLVVDGAPAPSTALAGPLREVPATPLVLGAYSTFDSPLQGALARVEVHRAAVDDATLAAGWAAFKAAAGEVTSFTFAQASDLHVTDTKSVEIVNDGVDHLNGDPSVAFSLWLGDLTQDSTPDAMHLVRYALDRLRRPHHALRGNHDLQPGIYQAQFGPLCQRVDFGGWRFLLADSNPGDDTPMAADQVSWLRDQLAETPPEMPLVLCTHHPLMRGTKAYRLAGADELLALFAGWNLKAALAGHYHGNQDEVVDGVLFTTTACLATTRDNFDGTKPRGYRRFHCDRESISTQFVAVRAG